VRDERAWRTSLRARLVMLRMLPRVHLPLTIAVGVLVLFAGLLPVAFTVASGSVVGAVPAAVGDGFDSAAGRRLIGWLILAGILFLAQQVVGVFTQVTAGSLGTRLTSHLRSRVMRASLRPIGVKHLEDPELLDKVSLAQGVGSGDFPPRVAVAAIANRSVTLLGAIGSGVLVARFSWWLALALAGSWLVVRTSMRREFLETVNVFIGKTQEMRRVAYFRDLALQPPAAKETRVFGLGDWVLDRYREHWLGAMTNVWRQRTRSHSGLRKGVPIVVASHLAALIMLALAGTRGDITLGALVIVANAIMGLGDLGNIDNNDFMLEYGVAPIPAVLELERVTGEVPIRLEEPPGAEALPRSEIRFSDVWFRYPASEVDVFAGLDLTIEAGRSLAIVGANGAGKTTLVKLMTRLYDAQHGRILVDGVDVRSLDPEAWRSRVGAIFQDFVRYEQPVADNIGFGASHRLQDRAAIRLAADRAGASEIIDALPNGWDTMLSPRYGGGSDLSGGQWQRVALARALFAVDAGASVLILDEPTANLDVRAEVEIFDRFLELTRGLTTIVISHRFSTVRRADRIVVLEHGRVVEDGSHDELIALGGRYAEMFRLQAERFTDDTLEGTVA